MSRTLRILVIDDNPDDRALILRELQREYSAPQVIQIVSSTDFTRALEEAGVYDLVITDHRLHWTDGLTILCTVKSRYPDCPVIMVTEPSGEETVVKAMKAGLDDYVLKAAHHFIRLPMAVRAALERSQHRRALRESEARFQAFMDNSPAVAFMKDEVGRHVYVNQPFERFFKLARAKWEGKTDFELWPEETARQLRENDRMVLDADKPAEMFEAVPGPDGILHHWLVFKFPIKGHDGQRFLGGMGVDITERKHLEQQLRQAQKMEAIGKLAGGIAHDFNNLVTIITGYSDMLLSRTGPEDSMRRELDQIKKAGERAHSLTRQLLAFSRRQMLQPKILDLNAVVTNLDPMLQRLIGENIELVTVLKPGLGQVKADPGQIEQVIMNLAINARDAMPQAGKLLIEVDNVQLDEAYARRHLPTQPGPYVCLAVSDTGCGMDAATQSRIFEPFFTTKGQGQGTGLGLSTVYGIVKQSGGYIWVYSEPGQGTTFKIYLPRVDAAADSVPPATDWSALPHGVETVLLVEDEPEVRWLMRDMLQQLGYTVLEARHGIEAQVLSVQHQGPIRLLITDVVMPQVSGREVAEQLAPDRPEMKVLYMSGYTDDAVVHHGVLAADIAFLQKPFTPETLARKIREVLDGQPGGS